MDVRDEAMTGKEHLHDGNGKPGKPGVLVVLGIRRLDEESTDRECQIMVLGPS